MNGILMCRLQTNEYELLRLPLVLKAFQSLNPLLYFSLGHIVILPIYRGIDQLHQSRPDFYQALMFKRLN